MADIPPQGGQRRDRMIHERIHDPYKTRDKIHEPSRCPECGAVYRGGRWSWGEAPADADEVRCQACHRIADGYPAGELTISGAFVAPHREEIVGLIHNQDQLERGEHPLHRVMAVEDRDDGLFVTTTDIHLPRRIGEALHHAYRGELDFHYDAEGYAIRVTWSRDD